MSINHMPLVTIVIPVYNCEKYIGKAISSLIDQTYKNIEIIVVDDGSTDETLKIVKSLGRNLKIIEKLNGGQSSALNKGWEEARGEIVGYLSADDLYYPTLIEDSISSFENPDVILSFPYFDLIDEHSFKIREIRPAWLGFNHLLSTLNNPIGPGVLFRKKIFIESDGWSVKFKQLQDLKFWLDVCDRGAVVVVPKVLAAFRVHHDSRTFASSTEAKAFEPVEIVNDYFKKNVSLVNTRIYKESLSNAHMLSGQLNIRSGRVILGLKHFRKGFQLNIMNIISYRVMRILLNACFSRGYYSYIFPIHRKLKDACSK